MKWQKSQSSQRVRQFFILKILCCAYRLHAAERKIDVKVRNIGQQKCYNDLRKRRRSLAWHEQRASRLKNFALVSARRALPGGIIPASVSERLCLPEMRLYGIFPSSRTERVPVPFLPASDVRHGWDGHAPHTSAVDGLVLGDLSLCHGQTRHFRCSAESHAGHLL